VAVALFVVVVVVVFVVVCSWCGGGCGGDGGNVGVSGGNFPFSHSFSATIPGMETAHRSQVKLLVS
jgi:hypothetical protein